MTDEQLREAFEWLRGWMMMYYPELLSLAAGRYAEGVFRYPERPLYAKSEAEVTVDLAQEIADAIVYAARKIELAEPKWKVLDAPDRSSS